MTDPACLDRETNDPSVANMGYEVVVRRAKASWFRMDDDALRLAADSSKDFGKHWREWAIGVGATPATSEDVLAI